MASNNEISEQDSLSNIEFVALFNESPESTLQSSRGRVHLSIDYAIKRLAVGKAEPEEKSFKMMKDNLTSDKICAMPVCYFEYEEDNGESYAYFVYRRHGNCVVDRFNKTIGLQILESFKCLSEHGVFHGDIRLSNILWNETSIRLIDFEAFKIMNIEQAAIQNGKSLATLFSHFGDSVIVSLNEGSFVDAISKLGEYV
jgi:serine/threonine protein kinase